VTIAEFENDFDIVLKLKSESLLHIVSRYLKSKTKLKKLKIGNSDLNKVEIKIQK